MNSASTITSDYELWCDNAYKKGLLGSSFFTVGILLTVITGIYANTKGRKFSLVLSWLIGSGAVLAIGLTAFHYSITIVMYALMGSFVAYLHMNRLYANEIGDTEFRNKANGVIAIAWVGGELPMIIISCYVTNWKILVAVFVTIPIVISCFCLCLLKETPLFLVARNKVKEFKDVLAYIAGVNNRKLDDKFDELGT